jgi:hypothetical protein
MQMDLQGTRRAILLVVECIGSDNWLTCIDGNTKRWGFSLNAKGFFPLNSVHGSRIRIFCRFYAKGQEFVRIRLE